jgi:LacI family transcriptional regulator, galactose operon repressor
MMRPVPGGETRRPPTTLRDVARAAGVHPGTASRALNPDTQALVNAATVERVRQVAEELGYRPNPMARGLRTNRTYTVGVLIPDIQNPLFPPIIRGLDDRLGAAGYTPLIANTDNDPVRERTDFEAMRARQVDGFITATARLDHVVLDAMDRAGLPLVLVNRRLEDGSLPSATADDFEGARLAVRHLAELGHERIAHLGGPQALSTGHQRLAGFRAAMAEHGLPVPEALVRVAGAFTERAGARGCEALLETGEPFTAIVAANDLVALGCYDVFARRGISCPRDVSVVGFNDMPFADRFNPPLTTIHIPHYDVGTAAAELLLERLREGAGPARQVVLPTRLVRRGSSAAPPVVA